jgi:signal transduction histidine kinase
VTGFTKSNHFNSQGKMFRAINWGKALLTTKQTLVARLRLWRWLVLIFGVVVTFSTELLEGHTFGDINFYLEFMIWGFVVPGVFWLLFTYLAEELERQNFQRHRLEKRRLLTQQLTQYQEWDELTRFIVQYPQSVLPIERVTLYIYEAATNNLQPNAFWGKALKKPPTNSLCPQSNKLCANCQSGGQTEVLACLFQSCPPEQQLWQDWCLPLNYQERLIGLLRLGVLPANPPSAEAQESLRAAATEFALALNRHHAVTSQMAQTRTAAQTYERRHIAQVLHNSLAQQIGYIHLNLDRLTHAPEGIEKEELTHMRDVAGEAYIRIRDTLAFLRSQEEADLLQSILEHIESLSKTAKVKIAVAAYGEPWALSPQLGSQIFSLVHEGLNNIIKHAAATQAQIALHWRADGLQIVIVDNGQGFATQTAPANGHYGLTMMRESVQELGGTLTLNSGVSRGTRLEFFVPLANTIQLAPWPDSGNQPLSTE